MDVKVESGVLLWKIEGTREGNQGVTRLDKTHPDHSSTTLPKIYSNFFISPEYLPQKATGKLIHDLGHDLHDPCPFRELFLPF